MTTFICACGVEAEGVDGSDIAAVFGWLIKHVCALDNVEEVSS